MIARLLIACTSSTLKSRSGATAIEYGLIAAGIALAISVGVYNFGDTLTTFFNELNLDRPA